MKTLLQLVEEWRKRQRSIDANRASFSSGTFGENANELEAWARELAGELDKAEANQKANRVGTLGPLYDVGINVARQEIRGLLGVSDD